MKKFLACLLIVGFFYFTFLPREAWGKIIRTGIKSNSTHSTGPFAPGRQYLFLIAIAEYLHWPQLREPVNETLQLKKVLVTRYHFDEIIELYNQQATKEAIRNCLIAFQAGQENQLQENDSLFIYFSGHGYSFAEEDWNGYWIPYNAGNDTDARAYWFSNSELSGLLNKIKSKHILVVSDTCFGSSLIEEKLEFTNESKEKKYCQSQSNYDRCTRKVLTSGGLERVPGQSVFAELLIAEFRKNCDPWLDIEGVYRAIEWEVVARTGHHPEYGNLKNTNFNSLNSYMLFAFPSLPR